MLPPPCRLADHNDHAPFLGVCDLLCPIDQARGGRCWSLGRPNFDKSKGGRGKAAGLALLCGAACALRLLCHGFCPLRTGQGHFIACVCRFRLCDRQRCIGFT